MYFAINTPQPFSRILYMITTDFFYMNEQFYIIFSEGTEPILGVYTVHGAIYKFMCVLILCRKQTC